MQMSFYLVERKNKKTGQLLTVKQVQEHLFFLQNELNLIYVNSLKKKIRYVNVSIFFSCHKPQKTSNPL